MPVTDKTKKKRGLRRALALFTALICLPGLFAACGSEPDAPPAPTEAPNVIVNPVNGGTAETLDDALRELSAEDGVLTPADGGYVYTDEDGDVTLTVTDPAEAEAALGSPSAAEGEDPSIVTGVIGDTEYIAVSSGGTVTVYITAGDRTVKAEAPRKDGKTKGTDAKTVKKTASVASSAVTASRVKEAYARGRDDYDHNKAAYYMELADCLIFYPAQLTKKTAFEDQSVIFSDERSSVTCALRLERNPYRDIDELDSLMRNSPNNTVLAHGDDWMTAESIRDGIVTFTYIGFGKKYMVTAELCYPRKYSFVFDELRELISVRFLEGNKWVNGNRQPKVKPEYGAPSYGLQERFYPEFELFLVIPDTLREMEVQGRRIVFHDDHRDSDVTVELFEIPETERDDLFRIFHVVAKDGDIVLGDDYIHWHNSNGMFLGAMCDSAAALMRFEGGDAFYAYEAVYDELICQIVDQFFESQMTSDPDAGLEAQMTSDPDAGLEAQMTTDPDAGLEQQMTTDPDAGLEQQMTTDPDAGLEAQRTHGDPPAKKAAPKREPNRIDEAVEKKVAEKTREEYPPAPERGNDPLEYYSDADWCAVNTTLENYVDSYIPEERMIADTILKVLRYNGYGEAEDIDAEDLMLALMDLMEEVDDTLFDWGLFGTDARLKADLFPYVCVALDMDEIPEYRNRPETAPPAPEWLKDWRSCEDFREEGLNWDEVRRILDEGEPMPDPYETIYEDAYPGLYFTDGAWTYDPGESGGHEGLTPVTSDIVPRSWPQFGIYFDEEAIRELEDLVSVDYAYYLDLAWQEDPEYWELSDKHYYEDLILGNEPDFDNVGWFSESRLGVYCTPDSDDPGEVYWMAVSEDGIWAVFDPDSGEAWDFGILIPDKDGYGDLWYTVNAEGQFMTFWEFDYGYLISSKYGSLEYQGRF